MNDQEFFEAIPGVSEFAEGYHELVTETIPEASDEVFDTIGDEAAEFAQELPGMLEATPPGKSLKVGIKVLDDAVERIMKLRVVQDAAQALHDAIVGRSPDQPAGGEGAD